MTGTTAITASPTRRIVCKAALAAAILALSVPAAQAQSYPNKSVRIIIPFGPGGMADTTSRLVAEKLGEKLGQRFIIENMPGAGGISAGRAALAAPADGYTLALITNGNAISVPLFKSLPFDPVKDFVPISLVGSFDCLLVANGESQYRTLQDIIKAAKEQPGKLNIGVINPGSTQHLTAELFKSMAGVDVVLVTFRTSPEAVVALLRNDVQMVVDFLPALKGALSDGKLRPLAWSGPQPFPSMPNVPTVQQSGVPGFEVISWNSLSAPAGTPPAVVETLNKALREVLADPELKKRALDVGIDIKASAPADVTARLRADIEKWSKVIERAGIQRQ
jgi:tripartite-type tricarboxylate transporter receptor subunit TctC